MKGEIRIRKLSQSEFLLWFVFVSLFIMDGLIEFGVLPYMIKYSLDIVWLSLLVLIYVNAKRIRLKSERALLWVVAGFLVYTLIVQIFSFQSLFYYLWGLRNNFRYYVVFFATIFFFGERLAADLIKTFDVVFWINVVVTLVQYFFFDINGDRLGGIFGAEIRVNQYTNVLLIIVLTYTIIRYLDHKEHVGYSISKLAFASLVAALTELKFFFVESIAILVIAVCITSFTWRKLGIMVGCCSCIIVGSIVLTELFAGGDLASMSIRNMIAIVTSEKGYTSSGDLNRLTAIGQINEMIFDHWWQRLFGLGLGNCDTSSFAICNTPFFEKYDYLHYSWFSIPMMYLETGYFGLTFFLGFYAAVFVLARKKLRSGSENDEFCQLGIIMSVLCCMLSIYNSSLRTEAAYMIYFILALPFIRCEKQGRKYS